MFQQNPGVALVGKMIAACQVDHDGAGEREQQKCGIDVPSPPQRTADHAAPALALTGPVVGQRAGHARDEHEYFRGIAEAVVARRQPASDIVGNMIEKDPPQGDPAADIDAQVAARPPELRRPLAEQWPEDVGSTMHLVARTRSRSDIG